MYEHGIMFHHFHDDNLYIKSQGSIDKKQLNDLLDFYQRDYRILPAKEWYEKARKKSLKEREVCITFDDALKCQFDIAYPVLKERGLSAFYFVYTSPLDGVPEKLEIYRDFRFLKFSNIEEFYEEFFELALLKDDEIECSIEKELKNFKPENFLKGYPFYTENDKKFRFLRDYILGDEKYNYLMDCMMTKHNYNISERSKLLWITKEELRVLHSEDNIIGLHSHTHPMTLSNVDYHGQQLEYETNKHILENIIHDSVYSASYPCNSYNLETLTLMKNLNIQIAFRANMEKDNGSLLEMPRQDHANILRRINE